MKQTVLAVSKSKPRVVVVIIIPFWCLEAQKIRASFFANLQTRQQAVNGNSASLQTKIGKAVEFSVSVSMHTGQIIMLTKMLSGTDLHFYGFEAGTPVERWRSGKVK